MIPKTFAIWRKRWSGSGSLEPNAASSLSFEAFAALASQGIVRGTKLKPFGEGLFGSLDSITLGGSGLAPGPPSPALRKRRVYLRSAQRLSAAFHLRSAVQPPQPDRKLSLPVRTWLSWLPAGLALPALSIDFSLTLVANIKVCSRAAASAGNRSSEPKQHRGCHA